MIDMLRNAKVAIVGCGHFCCSFLDLLSADIYYGENPVLMGVADIDPQAQGLLKAKAAGVFTATDYKALLDLDGLQVLFELAGDRKLSESIKASAPPHVEVVDHIKARAVWSTLQVHKVNFNALQEFAQTGIPSAEVASIISRFTNRVTDLITERNQRYEKIERDLVESQRAMDQIIQGSSIPTFVIDRKHIVTYWNRACEKLTGFSAADLVGTNRQWMPFRAKERPIMADLILDGVDEQEVWRYYGTRWRKSSLVSGAYEAEEYFPHLGESGLWLFFTAAPIKAPDGTIIAAIETLWDKTADKLAEEERERHTRELADSERAMAQIIQGSTVATFVINKDHNITHWNKACEKLTGHTTEEMTGTNRQWLPFYGKPRPTMADVILDQLEKSEIRKLYANWRKSPLIGGAYESEDFFPRLGPKGKWCFFTAAPIKAPDGSITGAIETLWDRTAYKQAEEERDRYYTEIAGLCSIYTALNTSLDLDQRIKAAIEEIGTFLAADGVCIFLLGEDENFHLKYNMGSSESLCRENKLAGENSVIYRVAKASKLLIYSDLPPEDNQEIGLLAREGLKSLAYIPISTEDGDTFGVIRIGSSQSSHFSEKERDILELIGNRIGVAIENSMLHEQYIRSEEKYRSLFNNDPNPTFILSRNTFKILDINQRAKDYYGWNRSELLGRSFMEMGDKDDSELSQGLASIREDESILFTKKRHYDHKGRALLRQYQRDCRRIRRRQRFDRRHHRYYRECAERDPADPGQ